MSLSNSLSPSVLNPGDPRVRDDATILTLNLSHLALVVSLSSRRELLLAVSSLDCKSVMK
ncbi:hypothetical protein C1H46_011738 [Malus baccata]|uniref:Uncharacterized protein n=1 Tax=Malus baccata TaxID=106549 RepID=A0A540MV58_MALBA|nr:hypothetical protein C1H46_011738 [Malus baccata]